VRVAIADPPYLGCCSLYGHHHPLGDRPFDGQCWNEEASHQRLIAWLTASYPDGWLLCLSSPSLFTMLRFCHEAGANDVRTGAWVKPFHAYKRGVRPAYAWEPVIFRGGRNKHHLAPAKGGAATTPKDFVAANITLQKGLTGVKPEAVCFWYFDLLNLQTGDEMTDVFAGSGAIANAWEAWQRRLCGKAAHGQADLFDHAPPTR
jgi:hypothetical protein